MALLTCGDTVNTWYSNYMYIVYVLACIKDKQKTSHKLTVNHNLIDCHYDDSGNLFVLIINMTSGQSRNVPQINCYRPILEFCRNFSSFHHALMIPTFHQKCNISRSKTRIMILPLFISWRRCRISHESKNNSHYLYYFRKNSRRPFWVFFIYPHYITHIHYIYNRFSHQIQLFSGIIDNNEEHTHVHRTLRNIRIQINKK